MSAPSFRLRLGHATIPARDIDVMVTFYTEVLGFHVTNRGEPVPGMGEMAFISQTPDEHHQIEVPLDDDSVKKSKETVLATAVSIRDRKFNHGPRKPGPEGKRRCASCDFLGLCGMPDAMATKAHGVPTT